eukprot:gene7241-6831_t
MQHRVFFGLSAAATTVCTQVPDFKAQMPSFQPSQEPNMNGDYDLAVTPGGKAGLFPASYKDYPGGAEYYDVYSPPMTTLYSQVWWAPLAPAPFPQAVGASTHCRRLCVQEMVQKYAGKKVAVVGFECDQPVPAPAPPASPCPPISATYNHHYNAGILGANARFKKVTLSGPEDPLAADLMAASHGRVNYDVPHYIPE